MSRPALPPHLTAEYLEMTRAAIDFNRPGIPVVASLPSVHIADIYGRAHRGRAGTVAAITAWAEEHDVPLVDLKAAVAEEVYCRPRQPGRHPLELRRARGRRRVDAQGARRSRRHGAGRRRLGVAVIVVTDSSARLRPDESRGRTGFEVVPLHILVDGADLRDGVDDIRHDIHDRHATTAGATPTELCAAYQRALAAAAATAWWAFTSRRHCRAPTALPSRPRGNSAPR